MKEISLPENVNIGFEPFCEGCTHFDIEVIQSCVAYEYITCKHMRACEALYDRIKGEDTEIIL